MPSSSCSSKPCVSRHLPREIRTRNQPTSPVGPLYIRHLLLIPHTGHSGGRHRQLRSAGTLRFKNSPIALIALARRSGRTSLTWVLVFCPPLFAILLTPLEGPLHGCVAACSRVISCWSFTGIKCVESGCPMSSCLFSCFFC